MEVVDRDREERLENVRRKKLRYQTTSICKNLVREILEESVKR